MKKKNVIGHMAVAKSRDHRWHRRIGLIPRLICLLLAILIWLFVVNANDYLEENDTPAVPGGAQTETVAE